MTPTYTAKLGLTLNPTNVSVQKINRLVLKTYKMTTARFLVIDKLGQIKFFEKTFLLANTSIEVVLGILFFSFNNVDVYFDEKEFT